jgi:DnaK suppressor protein
MNATVTRSATKSAAAKSVRKTAAKTATAPKSKTAAAPAKKSILKTVAGKLAKTIANTLKPASKTSSATTKAVAKPVKTTVKSSVGGVKPATAKPASKTSAKGTTTKKTTPVSTRAAAVKSTAPKASKGATASKQVSSTPVSALSSKETSGPFMSSNNASDGLTDKMEKPAVSKVSEVATKTTKSTPAVPADGALLTEEQILKMSDKDYMNEAQLAFFKARLQQLERDLLKNAGETTEHLRETVLVPDPADRATIEEEHALELRTRDRERKLLKKVQQSIASIDAGEYGWCEETGEPIGIPRLLARPTATLSLEAQQRRELKQKLYGD